MPQSLAKVYIHIVFSTKNRQPWITDEIRHRLYAYLGKVCTDQKFPLHQIGGMEDHLHLLVELPRTITIAKIVELVKSHSSRWVKQNFSTYPDFSWQSGYGVFSVDRRTFDAAKQYIANQPEHHKKRGFQEEYLELLERAEIEYDERYLWD